jgi:agmatine deiminase
MSFKNCLLLACLLSTTLLIAQKPTFKLPAYRTLAEQQLAAEKAASTKLSPFGKTGFIFPGKVRYPGEFEESQAVCISWSYDYDNLGNVIGIDTSSEYGFISAQLAKYISDELPVWIRVTTASDTLKVLAKMQNLGWPLTHNYTFFVIPGDDWWMRDFGPNGVYIGDKDSLAIIDLQYYDGRDLDDAFPKTVAAHLGIPNYESTFYGEGGNLMADGFGSVFFSDVMNEANDFQLGWDSVQTIDSLRNLFGATAPINLKALQCDGGTGHIDLYVKLADEQTLFVMEYPSVVTATDKKIIEDNYQYLTTLKSTYNRPYRIIRFPMPTNDNGVYNLKSCNQINADARTFINGITLNKTYLYPSYSNDVDGNKTQTALATALFEKHMSGYKVIPIDARASSPLGGSIHCITMQIPADNPVLIWHPSIDGYNLTTNPLPIQAKITNRSGIASAVCFWKKKTETTWHTTPLAASANDMFNGVIQPGPVTASDSIDYYIEAVTNNGKTAVKPITAPNGYYTIYYKPYATGVSETILPKNYVFGAYPNPASQSLTIPVQLIEDAASLSIKITDITGKEIESLNFGSVQAGFHKQQLNTAQFANGLYFYTVYQNGTAIGTRKFIIKH